MRTFIFISIEMYGFYRKVVDHIIFIGGIQHQVNSHDTVNYLKILLPKKALIFYQGCHLGNFNAENWHETMWGHVEEPIFEYKGIPAVHFEKQSCTAWHSDRLSEENTVHVRTTLMHNLGMHGRQALNKKLPHVVTPVFAKMANGKIGPHNMIWS